jgi:hypothetical protein
MNRSISDRSTTADNHGSSTSTERHAGVDQRMRRTEGNPNGVGKAMSHAGDFGGGAVFVDDQTDELDSAESERAHRVA